MQGIENWQGNSTELLDALKKVVREDAQKEKDWPSAPKTLSHRLMLLEGFLGSKGIFIKWERNQTKRLIILTKRNGNKVSTGSEREAPAENTAPAVAVRTEAAQPMEEIDYTEESPVDYSKPEETQNPPSEAPSDGNAVQNAEVSDDDELATYI